MIILNITGKQQALKPLYLSITHLGVSKAYSVLSDSEERKKYNENEAVRRMQEQDQYNNTHKFYTQFRHNTQQKYKTQKQPRTQQPHQSYRQQRCHQPDSQTTYNFPYASFGEFH